MSQKLRGNWNSRLVLPVSGGTGTTISEDGTINVGTVAGGEIQNSTHTAVGGQTHNIQGRVVTTGASFAVRIESSGENLLYEGVLSHENPNQAGHPNILVITGTRGPLRTPLRAEGEAPGEEEGDEAKEGQGKGPKRQSQEQATWVATKQG